MRLVDVRNVECTRLKFRNIVFLSVVLMTFGVEASQPSDRLVPRLKGHFNSPYGYWEYLPKDYHNSSARFPVVIYLHGVKEIGNGTLLDLDKIARNGVPYVIRKHQRDFPFIVISPQSPSMEEGFSVKGLKQLLEVISANYKIDENRIYLTGISYGAYAALRLASHIPDRLAAIVTFSSCGGDYDLSKLKDIPIWAFGNARDTHGIPECIRDFVERLRDHGGTPLLTLYPRKGHNSWEKTYKNNFIWDWLLKQHRGEKNVNQPPILINPGNKVVGIGARAYYTIMASDANNDSLKFEINGQVVEGSRFLIRKNGHAELMLNTLVPGIFNVSISVNDGKGGSSRQSFYLRTSYTLLLLPYLLLSFLQPFILELPLISLFLLLELIKELTTEFFQLIIRFFPWLFMTTLVTFEI